MAPPQPIFLFLPSSTANIHQLKKYNNLWGHFSLNRKMIPWTINYLGWSCFECLSYKPIIMFFQINVLIRSLESQCWTWILESPPTFHQGQKSLLLDLCLPHDHLVSLFTLEVTGTSLPYKATQFLLGFGKLWITHLKPACGTVQNIHIAHTTKLIVKWIFLFTVS